MTQGISAWSDVENGTVPITDGELFYEAAGTGPAVVLLHGALLDQRMWDEQFVWLVNSGLRVIRYDLRGHGLSATATGDFAHHDDLRALLDALAVERAALVGLSHGSRVALDAALVHPDRVTALALASPGISGRPFTDPFLLGHLREQAAASGEEDGVERYVEHFLRAWVDGPHRAPEAVHPGLRERLRAAAEANVEVHAEGTGMPLEAGAAARLGELRVPTLVLDGDLDSRDISANAHAITLAVPGARRVRIPGAGHMVNLENAAHFDHALHGFLASLSH